MANQNNNYQRGGYPNNYGNRSKNQGGAQQAPEIKPLPVPDEYVDVAENVIRSIGTKLQNSEKYKIPITASKLRGFLSLLDDIYNDESRRTEKELLPESQLKIKRLRVRMVYDAGRDAKVESFVEKANLLSYLKGIGTSREALIKLTHYMEALVAYHRYLGGSEN